MQGSEKFREDLRSALDKGVLRRLPLTFLPFVNQQLEQWEYLFPNEQKSVEGLLLYVAVLSPEQSSMLFHDVVELEQQMGVRHWEFSTTQQTIQNSSQLARSPYFLEWRAAVQAVFDAVDQHAARANEVLARHRLILLDIPRSIPVEGPDAWRQWHGIGKPFNLEATTDYDRRGALEFLLQPVPEDTAVSSSGLLGATAQPPKISTADEWVLDVGMGLEDLGSSPGPSLPPVSGYVSLSYARLEAYRKSFSHEMNTMRKDLADADAVLDRLRKVDVTSWCPEEIAHNPAVREFVRSLFLSGNGAVIFGNSFVEWGASEALRRARPSLLAARFGIRAKPKPFTGVAVFDDPDQVNPAPPVDDLAGSALDTEVLALYIWLAATRYNEYQQHTACVCVAEHIAQAYIVAPPEFPVWQYRDKISLPQLRSALGTWMAQNTS
jgi:hypothetical protein